MSTEEVSEKTGKESHTIYEVGYLLLPTIAEEKLGAIVAKLHAVIVEKGSSIIAEEAPKMRALDYPMSKVIDTKNQSFDHAYFAWIKFEIASDEVASIKKSIETQGEVLRALFIKTVKESTLMASKVSEREAQKGAGGKVAEGVVAPADEAVEASGEKLVEKTKVDEEEMDKSIEALVIN